MHIGEGKETKDVYEAGYVLAPDEGLSLVDVLPFAALERRRPLAPAMPIVAVRTPSGSVSRGWRQ